MSLSIDGLHAALVEAACAELEEAASRVAHCLRQLSEEQVWWRPRPEMNAIGNLMLHICGNLQQWVVSGLGEEPDRRNRPAEFAERGPIASSVLESQLTACVNRAQEVLRRLPPERWVSRIRVQGFDVTGVGALWHSVPHFRGHVQEIIHLTRVQLGPAYQFAWQPLTPEQGRGDA
jgi:hypothetical protein